MKKYLLYIIFGLALMDLVVLLYLIGNKEVLGISIMHPGVLACGVSFIILFTIAFAQLMKRMDE